MDLKVHFVLLRRPIQVAIHRVLLWAHFCLALSTVDPPSSPRVSLYLGADISHSQTLAHIQLPMDNWLIVAGVEHRVTLSHGFKEDKHVEGWRCVMHHFGVKHTQGCDGNYTFWEGQSGDLACTGCWTWPWRDISGGTDLEGSHQSLHFIYVLHATS